MGETKIKIQKGRRPTPEQIRQALRLAQSRGDDKITLVDPGSGEVWGTAPVTEVETYVKAIEAVRWPFFSARRNKVTIE